MTSPKLSKIYLSTTKLLSNGFRHTVDCTAMKKQTPLPKKHPAVKRLMKQEEKTLLKRNQRGDWKTRHPNENKNDPYYQLTQREQVIVFRLRTGHNKQRWHLYNKLKLEKQTSARVEMASKTLITSSKDAAYTTCNDRRFGPPL